MNQQNEIIQLQKGIQLFCFLITFWQRKCYFFILVTDDEKPPTLENEIKLRYPEHVRVIYLDEEDDDDNVDMSQIDDDDESEMEEDEEEV